MAEVDEHPGGNVLTVAELNRTLSETIDEIPAFQEVRCLGEISSIDEYDWGVFIDLVYEDCELSALMWTSRYRQLSVDLEPGMEVIFTGSIDFYPEDGTISLKPWEAAVLGEGDRAIQLQQLRAELKERGWFEETHKQPLPQFPRRIGVVTSLDGDARYDIEDSIHTRYPDVDLLIQDARVQGDRAPESIASGIHSLDRESDVDVIIVGRGGGSETDLAAFDSEAVAEAVFTAQTPVVVAVGHREDEPLVSEVADATAITPTEAGTTVVENRAEIEEHVRKLAGETDRAYNRLVQTRIDEVGRDLETAYDGTVRDQLVELEQRVENAYVTHEQRAEQASQLKRYKYLIVILVVVLLLLGTFVLFQLL